MNNLANIGQYMNNFQQNVGSLTRSVKDLENQIFKIQQDINDAHNSDIDQEELAKRIEAQVKENLEKSSVIQELTNRLLKIETMNNTLESIFATLPPVPPPLPTLQESSVVEAEAVVEEQIVLPEVVEESDAKAPKKKLTKKK